MKSLLRLATRTFAPVGVVGAVLVASYFAPAHLSGVLAVACGYTSPTPTVTGVSPSSGSATGGTSVTITGTQFCNGAVTVNFGATPGTGATVNSNTSITVTSPAHAVGNVDVIVTTAGGTSATSSADQYTFTQPPCATAGLSSDKASPQNTGTVITFTATSTVCANPEYLFYLQSPGGGWTLMQGFDGATWVWNTTGFAAGNYVVNVWVRQIGSGRTFDANFLMPFTLGTAPPPPACTAAGLTSDLASPQQVDFKITFTATSATCPNPEYLFYLQSPGGAWTLARGYGGPVWVWDTSTVPSVGNFVVNVWVRQAGSGVPFQTNFLLPYTLTNRVCTAAGLTSDLASPQQVDFKITFTATSASCARPEYLFYLQSPGTGWAIVQGYGGPTWVWDTSTLPSVGTFTVDVWVRAIGSAAANQTVQAVPYVITNRMCTAAGLTANKASPQVYGTVITFTATSASCARPEYLFYLKTPGTSGTWSVVQGYGGTTWVWNTAGAPSVGTYTVDVWVRAVGSGVANQTVLAIPYTLT